MYYQDLEAYRGKDALNLTCYNLFFNTCQWSLSFT